MFPACIFPSPQLRGGTFLGVAFVSFCLQIKIGQQKISARSMFEFIFPHEGCSTKSSKLDIFMYFAKKLIDKALPITFVFVTLAISSGIVHLLKVMDPFHTSLHIGFVGLMFCSIVVFLTVDLANYVSYAWEHYVPALWEHHKVHHSATFLQPTTTARVHPFETLFDGLLASIFMSVPISLFMFVYEITLVDCLIIVANANLIGTIAVLDVLRHSHFPISFGRLDGILLSPHMHQAHHSVARRHWDLNFGNKLSIWDWLFGTGIKPKPGEESVYGLGTPEDADYERLSGLYLMPVVKIWRVAREKRLGGFMMRKGARFNRRGKMRPIQARFDRQVPLTSTEVTPLGSGGERPADCQAFGAMPDVAS